MYVKSINGVLNTKYLEVKPLFFRLMKRTLTIVICMHQTEVDKSKTIYIHIVYACMYAHLWYVFGKPNVWSSLIKNN